MKEQSPPIFSPEQFFELETTCDLIEQELKRGKSPDVEEMIGKVSPEIRRVLRQEIGLLLDEYAQKSNDETINPLGQTVTPTTDRTHRRRSVSFEASHFGDRDVSEPGEDGRTSFGRFQLHSIVGRGGSGTVWKAYDGNLDRWVALKISHPRSTPDAKRFVREAQAVAQLKHSGIIPVYEAGELNGTCFLVSEFCDGQPLSQLMKSGPIDVARAVELTLAIIDALEHSHQMGIVHRDIKPHNVMVTPEGLPLVTDFGLARNLLLDQTLTQEGELIGTPGYMAPEQAKGGGVACDERTDIYSIGVLLFQLLAGQLPFTGSFERVIFQVINSMPPHLGSINADVPEGLAAICAKCLEKAPERRFQSASELADELHRFATGKRVETRRVTWRGRYARWLQREPAIAWLTTICALSLLMTTVGSSWAAYSLATAWRNEKIQLAETKNALADAVEAQRKEGLARERAESAERVAKQKTLQTERLAKASRQESDFLMTLLAPVDIIGVSQMQAGGTKTTHLLSAETIEAATDEVNRLVESPRVQARIKGMLANAWRSLGQFDQARSLLIESTELLVQCSENGDEQMVCDRAMNQLYWAYWFHHNEDFVGAEKYYLKAIELHQESVKESGQSITCLLQLAQAEFGLGALFLRQRMNEQAEPYLRSALEKRRQHLSQSDSLLLATKLAYVQCKPETTEVDLAKLLTSFDQDVVQRGMLLYWEIVALRDKKAFSKAAPLYEKLLQLIRDSIGEDNALYVIAVGDFASLQRRAGNYREAYGLIEDAIERGAGMSRWHSARMGAMMSLESELQLAFRFSEAKELLLEVARHRLPKWNDSVRLHLDLAWCNFHLGDFEQAVVHSKPPLRAIGNCTAAETAWFCYTHATMLSAVGDSENAKQFYQQAIDTVEEMVRNSHLPDHSTWLKRSGVVLMHHGHDREAERLLRQAIKVAEREYFAGHPRVAGLKLCLAENLVRQQKFADAEQLVKRALEVQERCLPEDDKRIAQSKQLLDTLQNQN